MNKVTFGLFLGAMVGISGTAFAQQQQVYDSSSGSYGTQSGDTVQMNNGVTYTVTSQAGAIQTVRGSDGSSGTVINPSYYTNYELGGPDPDNPQPAAKKPAQTAGSSDDSSDDESSNNSYTPPQPPAPRPPRDPGVRTASYSCAAGTSASTIQEEACQAKTAAILKNMGCTLTTSDKDCKYANNVWTCSSPSNCDTSSNYSDNSCPDGYVSETFDSKKAIKSVGGTLQINGLCVSQANSQLYQAFLQSLAAKKQAAAIAAQQAQAAAALKAAVAAFQCPIDPCYVCGANNPPVPVDGWQEYFPTAADEVAHFSATNCKLSPNAQAPFDYTAGYSVQGCRTDASQCKEGTQKNKITWRCDSNSATDCENNAIKWFKSKNVECTMSAGTAPECDLVLPDFFVGWNCTAYSDNCTTPIYADSTYHRSGLSCPVGSVTIAPLSTGGKVDPICGADCPKGKVQDPQSLSVCKWQPTSQPAGVAPAPGGASSSGQAGGS